MNNYFFNIIIPDFDNTDLKSDVLTSVRKDFYLSRLPQKGKITQNSENNFLYYSYVMEQDHMLKWHVFNDTTVLSESKSLGNGNYGVYYYNNSAIYKRIVFSRHHTLLKIEYFDRNKGPEPYCVVEPRKSNTGLCLLVNRYDSIQPVILYSMPDVNDEFALSRINNEFTDFTALAYTNDGIVRFLSKQQLELFEQFLDRCAAIKLTTNTPDSYIAQDDALLAKKLNPKDFNVKRNLSEIIDITMSDEFVSDENQNTQPTAEFKLDIDKIFDNVQQDDNEDLITLLNSSQIQSILSDLDDSKESEKDIVTDNISDVSDSVDLDIDSALAQFLAEAGSGDQSSAKKVPSDDLSEISDDDFSTNDIEPTQGDLVFESPKTAEDDFDFASYDTPDLRIDSNHKEYYYYGDVVDNVRQGYGRTATKDGHTTYDGYYSDNKRNGVGTYFYPDGTLCYYGNWKDNNREGFGMAVSSVDKSIHVGDFSSNKPSGSGVRLDSQGNVVFVQRSLTDGSVILVKFVDNNMILSKYNESGDKLAEQITSLTDFSD